MKFSQSFIETFLTISWTLEDKIYYTICGFCRERESLQNCIKMKDVKPYVTLYRSYKDAGILIKNEILTIVYRHLSYNILGTRKQNVPALNK